LIGPLGRYRDQVGLSSFEQALLVARPGRRFARRVPVGAVTDGSGGRTIATRHQSPDDSSLLFLGLVAESYWARLLGGLVLGRGGTAFAVGVPQVNA
jgi:NNP family nitrate/nitrite transporter-like MFS transporter